MVVYNQVEYCGRNSAVECQLPKLKVEGSNPFARFFFTEKNVIESKRMDKKDLAQRKLLKMMAGTILGAYLPGEKFLRIFKQVCN
jgi:hypothetical protein